jgi:hypothetical protein
MTSQREQYGNTIHLFIGTGRSPCKITLMPFTFINNSIVILRGLIWLFIFKSVSSSCRYAEALLHIASWSSYPSSWSPSWSSFVLTTFLYTRNLTSKVPVHIFLFGKHSQITFLRTFGSRRPPTTAVYCDVVTLLNMWCLGGKRQTPARVISTGRGASGYDGQLTASSAVKIFSPSVVIRTPEHTNRNTDEDHGARPPAATGSLNQWSGLVTVPSRSSSDVLIERIEELCSQFFMWQPTNMFVSKLLSNVPAAALLQGPCSNIH